MQSATKTLPTSVRVGGRTVRIQQRLGNGAFGVVYKVKDEATSTVYALKDVLCLNASALRNAVREATTLNKISHQNVIAVIGADQFRDSKGLHMLLLTEYCSGGSLNDRLARPSSEEENMKWIRQTAAALAHLHSHVNVNQDEGSWLASYTQYYMNSGVGPVHWVAPELFTGHYTEKADVFSLGTLFFAILERDFIVIDGKRIYGTFVNIRGNTLGLGLAMAEDSSISITFSSRAQRSYAMQRLVLKALQYDRNKRPSAQKIYDQVMDIIQRVMLHQQNSQQSSQQPQQQWKSDPQWWSDQQWKSDPKVSAEWWAYKQWKSDQQRKSDQQWKSDRKGWSDQQWTSDEEFFQSDSTNSGDFNNRSHSNSSMAPATDYATCRVHGSSISVPPTTDYDAYFRTGLQQHDGSNISMAPTTDHTSYITTGLQQNHGSNISLAQIRDSVPTTTAMASKKESLPLFLSIVFTLLLFLYHLIKNWGQRELELIEQ